MTVKKFIAYDPEDLENQLNIFISENNIIIERTNMLLKDTKFICFIFYEVQDE